MLSSLVIAIIAFVCMLGSALLARRFGHRLPGHHHESLSKDTVRLGMALIATVSGMILGLILSSAKGTFDAQTALIRQSAQDLLQLDRALQEYGPQTAQVRESIRQMVVDSVVRLWPEEPAPGEVRPTQGSLAVINQIIDLQPESARQHWYQARALTLSADILQAHWASSHGLTSTIHPLLVVSIISWLTVLFASFGLFAPRNHTVVTALLLCSLSMASAILLILEMEDPYAGIMKVSSEPLRFALSQIAR